MSEWKRQPVLELINRLVDVPRWSTWLWGCSNFWSWGTQRGSQSPGSPRHMSLGPPQGFLSTKNNLSVMVNSILVNVHRNQKNQCRRIKTLSIISLQSVVSVRMYLLRKFALIYSIFPYFTQNTWYHAKLCSPKLWFVPSKKDLGLVQGGMRGHGARGVVVELGKNLNRLPYKMTRPM